MQDPDDIRAMLEGVQMIFKITQTKSMRCLVTTFNAKPFLSCEHLTFHCKAYWKCSRRRYGSSLQHQVGTCKMGPPSDAAAVVDPQLRVHGIKHSLVLAIIYSNVFMKNSRHQCDQRNH